MRGIIDRRLEHGARWADEDPGASLAAFSAEFRRAVMEACREDLGEEVQARGSHPFADGDALDQAQRGLGLFALQHRLLEPAFARPDERREAVLGRGARP